MTKEVQLRITKTFGMIVGGHIVCWLPVQVAFFAIAFTGDAEYFTQVWYMEMMFFAAISGAHINSATNPFIYAYRIKGIRDAIKKTLSCFCMTDSSESILL